MDNYADLSKSAMKITFKSVIFAFFISILREMSKKKKTGADATRFFYCLEVISSPNIAFTSETDIYVVSHTILTGQVSFSHSP